jgi:hypothetical protein
MTELAKASTSGILNEESVQSASEVDSQGDCAVGNEVTFSFALSDSKFTYLFNLKRKVQIFLLSRRKEMTFSSKESI